MNKKYIILYILLIIQSTIACTIPVFRYAQINWQLDAYIAEIIYSDSLSREDNKLLQNIQNHSFKGDSTLNIYINYIDISKNNSEKYSDIDKTHLPLISLYYPKKTKNKAPIWQGKLSKNNIDNLINSPSRLELLKNLKNKDVAVFLFYESGNKDIDEKYYIILKEQLEILSKTLSLPDSAIDVNGLPIDGTSRNIFKINFSIVKVQKENNQENIFKNILLNTEPDLKYFKSPIVYPVFGKGRMLYGLVGKGINITNIKFACNSLLQWCSCTIKDENAGNDLLLYSDWYQVTDTTQYISEPIPDLSGLSDFIVQDTTKTDNIKTMIEPVIINISKKDTANQEILINDKDEVSQLNTNVKNLIIITIILIFTIIILITFIIKKTK